MVPFIIQVTWKIQKQLWKDQKDYKKGTDNVSFFIYVVYCLNFWM